jgi:4-hydroxy-tetrahydrodipicolinate synthase
MFEGLTVAMVTPFREAGLDLEATERLVEFLIAGGTEHLVVSGSTGEAATCSVEERRTLWRFVKERVKGRISVIAGTGTNSTSDSIALTQMAEELGLDGAMLVTPYYNKPTPRGQIAHFTAVARSTRLPIVVYNVPGRTGTNTMPETLAALGTVDNVVAVKEASGSIDQASAVRVKVPYTLLSGDDSLTLPMIAVGAAGIVSVAGNVAPELMRQLTDHARAGRMAEAEKVHRRLLPLFKALFVESNPGPVKFLLSAMGLMANQVRLPLVPVEPATEKVVLEAAKVVGLAMAAPAGSQA